MISITYDVQTLVNHHAVNAPKLEQNVELKHIIKQMESLKSPIPEEENTAMDFNSGGGMQTNNVYHGSGQQINNNAPVSSQNFNSGKE